MVIPRQVLLLSISHYLLAGPKHSCATCDFHNFQLESCSIARTSLTIFFGRTVTKAVYLLTSLTYSIY